MINTIIYSVIELTKSKATKEKTEKDSTPKWEKSVMLKVSKHNLVVTSLIQALQTEDVDNKQWLIENALKNVEPSPEQLWNKSWKAGKRPKVE